ncbi:hypothetical protein [Streptacidiphilus sp. MAP5-52]|uniref:hypothetical protein n=1 Tax=Streptacidiphilus sp. MAP5-52 TaxID=3156267 RepID=UPI00351281F2
MTTDHAASQLPDQPQTEPEHQDGRMVQWLKARRWDLDFWLNYTLWPWLRTTARPWAARRLREIERALDNGWTGTVAWLRALIGLLVASAAIALIGEAIQAALSLWRHSQIGAHHSGIVQTIARPVHAYITAHATGLPTDPGTVWALWQLAAPVLLILALTGSIAARLLWLGYGAATAAAVWMATPDPGRPVALALAVAAWGVASIVALYGMRLLPLVVVNVKRPRLVLRSTRSARAALPAAAADRAQEAGPQ